MDDGEKKMMRNAEKELLMVDTSEIARQVKDRLQSSGISQKVSFVFLFKCYKNYLWFRLTRSSNHFRIEYFAVCSF